MDKMTRYLRVSEEKIRSKGVESIRSRVVNLSELKPCLTIDAAAEAVADAFSESYGGSAGIRYGIDWMDGAALSEYYSKYSSWKWLYGVSPDFDIELSSRFSWGSVEFGLKLEKGIVKSAAVYSDAMDEELISMLPNAVEGLSFVSSELSRAFRSLDVDEDRRKMLEDIAGWIGEKGF
jgi:lipoate-protein ligase A